MDNPGKFNKDEEDDAKLVEDGEPNLKVELQLVGNDPLNGDTKFNMPEIKAAFVGMGKEELMKFAKDPFWVKLRWFLFVLFWLLWFGMLFGAIAIILLAPKCSSPEPRDWYENSPIYYVNVANFKDGAVPKGGVGDLEGLLEKVEYFKEIGVDTLLIDPLMLSTNGDPERIEDFKQVDPRYGSLDSVRKSLSSLKEAGLHIIMRIVPNYSSYNHTWFQKSINKIAPYTDYYIWSNGKADQPPNNWLSVYGGSAWTYNENRKQYYLHQFNETQPDLNFRNPEVVNYFSEVFKWWIDLGLSGIHLDKVDFLLENSNLTDEVISSTPGYIHDEYDFFNHQNTRYSIEVIDIIKQWAAVIRNTSGVFTVSGLPDSVELDSVNLIHRPLVIKKGILTAEALQHYVNVTLRINHRTWTVDAVKDNLPLDSAECLSNMMLLLPGTLVVPSGSELGLNTSSIMPWDLSKNNAGFSSANSTWKELPSNYHEFNVEKEKLESDSYFNTFKTLVKERGSPSIIHGTMEYSVVNSTVFVFTRLKSGNPGFLVAFNLYSQERVINLNPLKHVPEELTVIARSKSLRESFPLKTSIPSTNVKMAPSSCIVLQFVPRNEEV